MIYACDYFSKFFLICHKESNFTAEDYAENIIVKNIIYLEDIICVFLDCPEYRDSFIIFVDKGYHVLRVDKQL